jgi:putative membrane protein
MRLAAGMTRAPEGRFHVSEGLTTLVPLVNTSLIVISGVFLLIGYYFIRTKQVILHRRAMLTATTFAALFLVVYVARALLFPTKFFAGEGLLRVVYLAVLISHTILATVVGPLVLVVLYRAFKGQFPKHRKLARLTLPIWLYVVVTGWLIYLMLYVLE